MTMFLLMACKTKKVLNTSSSEIEKVQTTSENKTENQIEKTQQKQETKKVDLVDQKKERQTEIEIKGKAEPDKPIELYNIENGDTLQTIKVTGNADVSIRTKTSKSDQVKKENSSESLIEKFKEFSENIVEENNVRERIKEVKNKSKEIKVKGFQAGLWIVIALSLIILIFIFFTYKYFKK